MDRFHSHGNHDSCCSSNHSTALRQSLVEMEFERGIWYAAQNNDVDRLEQLLCKGISSDVEDSAGYTALHYAARNGHYKVCERLLKAGADVNARTRSGQATALHRAATQGHVDIVELLLKSGANANLKDADGYTSLHRALLSESESVCKLLIPCTDLTLVDNNGRTVMQLAEQSRNSALRNICILNKQTNVNYCT